MSGPASARAAVPEMTGAASVPAMIVAHVFMVSFLFTLVNTRYWAGRHLETDVASGFTAIKSPYERMNRAEGNVAGTRVFIIQR